MVEWLVKLAFVRVPLGVNSGCPAMLREMAELQEAPSSVLEGWIQEMD
jgi:hypothetical protein